MFRNVSRLIRRCAAALSIALLGQGAANAGLVTGEWDPVFGPALPNLSWQVRSNWLVPNACSSQSDGIYSTSLAGPCQDTGANLQLLSVWVRWYNTAGGDPNDFFHTPDAISAYTGWCETAYALGEPNCNLGNTFFFTEGVGIPPLSATNVRVASGQVVGFDTNITSFLTSFLPSSSGAHQYDLNFTTNGPVFKCVTNAPCNVSGGIAGSTAGLDQFLITFNSNDKTAPKFTDGQGQALGAVLDETGAYIGQRAVPEPGVPLLVLSALLGLGLSRRRRAR